MPEPIDTILYEKVKTEIYRKNPIHSAYRSGLLVQEYKRRGGRYKGQSLEKEGLKRWFKEDWRTQSGEKTYHKKGDIFRPTKRVTADTPITMSELTKVEKKKASIEKAKTGRVKSFKNSNLTTYYNESSFFKKR